MSRLLPGVFPKLEPWRLWTRPRRSSSAGSWPTSRTLVTTRRSWRTALTKRPVPGPRPRGAAGADFLLFLACENAYVHPVRHSRLARLRKQLQGLRSVLDDRIWESRWRDHLLRLDDLREKIGDTAWDAALARVDDTDRALVRLLLKGGLAR
ncbi:hypothetical protein [Streptomyces sp. ME19-01-6]|uniref:hypothetical protein n=1 Tax=Streptomyces sp. ME19-01-6 TaxID=3028686 RepID=UPI0029B3C2D5|nr:hypothetical protein [Streptomyces sp. ME19-01-6]MDX3233190.1 hypothetical protein [Streptomyces sp. ME19-01-6]